MPENAPSFFRAAFEEARERERPIVINFSAVWCAPCKRLKKETLAAPEVSELLARVQWVYVDVEKHPQLARAYEVSTIPDVLFIDREGAIVDRLRNFEPPASFRERLARLLDD